MVDKVSFKERLQNTDDVLEIVSVPVLQGDVIKEKSTDATIEEAEKVWPILEASLDSKMGYGLAACQIGIHKRIGFVKFGDKTFRLLNTKITSRDGETIMFGEGCLSIPGKHMNTLRNSQITVEDDILGKFILSEKDDGLLCVIFQHEVDHFDGITIFDRRQVPIVHTSKKVGRNELCPCNSGKKYKKCCIK